MFAEADKKFMKRALELAQRGKGFVSPNPLVGAVIVNNGRIVGEGFHANYGEDHAEVIALKEAGKEAEGARLYVNLEPCSHHGKTPPCSLRVIEAGIKEVYIANKDPNPKVNGQGITLLRERGIEVKTGLLAEEGERLNEAFFLAQREKRAFINFKAAQTLDGYLAAPGGDARWITGEKARKYGHKLRHELDAVMIGIGTLLADNPRLTVRDFPIKANQPARIILDSYLQFPLEARLLSEDGGGDIYIFTGKNPRERKRANSNDFSTADFKARKARFKELDNVEIIETPMSAEGLLSPEKIVKKLAELGFINILLEGGSRVNYSFQRAGLINKYYFFLAPKLMTGNNGVPVFAGDAPKKIKELPEFNIVTQKFLGEDLLLVAYPQD